MKVLFDSLHLNDHTLGFYPQTTIKPFLDRLRASPHLSPVTGLAGLPGRVLSVHMGNFSLVNLDEIHETQQNGGTSTCIVRACRSFVDSCNFPNEANLDAFEVEIHTP